MTRTGWAVIGQGAERRIAEFRFNDYDTLLTYEQAKDEALASLREHVKPYLCRIKELEEDHFRVEGALPRNKGWFALRGRLGWTLVTAKSKKRAMELLGMSRHCFNSSFFEAPGDDWYRLAGEEAIWIEEEDEHGKGTGVFYKPVARDEAERVLEQQLAPYLRLSAEEIASRIGVDFNTTGVSSQGTPYRLRITICRYEWQPNTVQIEATLDDGLTEGCREWKCIDRDISKATFATADWTKEGF